LKGGTNELRIAFKRFNTSTQGDSEIDFKEFKKTLANLGLQGLSDADMKILFNKYDTDKGGTIDFQEFVQNVMKRRASQNSFSFHCTGERDRLRLREKASCIDNRNMKMHWRYHSGDIDALEKAVVDKIRQKTKGGPYELRQAFGVFDKSSGDGVGIDFKLFLEGLQRLGIAGIPQNQARKLFQRYDKSKDGKIDFTEFLQQINRASIPETQCKEKTIKSKRQCCKHCCCHNKNYRKKTLA